MGGQGVPKAVPPMPGGSHYQGPDIPPTQNLHQSVPTQQAREVWVSLQVNLMPRKVGPKAPTNFSRALSADFWRNKLTNTGRPRYGDPDVEVLDVQVSDEEVRVLLGAG